MEEIKSPEVRRDRKHYRNILNPLALACKDNQVTIKWLDAGKTIGKIVIKNGSGLKCPRDYSVCQIILKQISGPTLDDIKLEFTLSIPTTITVSECDSAIGRALEKVLLTVKQSEVCIVLVKIRSIELYEDQELDIKDVLINFKFELQLISFESQIEIYEVDDLLKIERAKKHKQKGVELYQSNLVYSAFYRFSKALKLLIFSLNPPTFESRAQHRQLTIACYLNIALCQLTTKRYEFVVKNCSEVLLLDANNSKGYYRRAIAYMNLEDFENAKNDLKKAYKLRPNNDEIKNQMKIVESKLKENDLTLRKRLQRFFN